MGLTNNKNAPINEIVGFLEIFGKKEIQKIRSQYPNYEDILKPGILMGDKDIDDEIEELKVRTHISKVGINIMIQKADSVLPKIKSKLKIHSRIQFISQITLAISSTLILIYPLEEINQISKFLLGIITLVPSLLTIYVQHKSGITGYNEGNLSKIFNDLVDHKLNAEHYLRELIILDKLKPSTSIKYAQETIKKSNIISIEIKKIIQKYIIS
ncbi:hypothetical protein KORDIASMS9_03926 [Kordia sp. SMS9]|uniref:hypothetical protein n=1 Tax=Kordia sp. SMS9 TaxID=2282170 RepID=UPI000E0D8CA1|nr:hypothetical protein [Kordia sp. SMS9]AXG71669.1 hypothetical protein KORDIASMS9_03926 [Kordia sp. SMS9]